MKHLHRVLTAPYEEGSPEDIQKYYNKRPEGLERKGGVGWMSCSS